MCLFDLCRSFSLLPPAATVFPNFCRGYVCVSTKTGKLDSPKLSFMFEKVLSARPAGTGELTPL